MDSEYKKDKTFNWELFSLIPSFPFQQFRLQMYKQFEKKKQDNNIFVYFFWWPPSSEFAKKLALFGIKIIIKRELQWKRFFQDFSLMHFLEWSEMNLDKTAIHAFYFVLHYGQYFALCDIYAFSFFSLVWVFAFLLLL